MECVLQGVYFAIVLLLEVTHAHQLAQVFMVESPSSVTMPINDETILTCKMNITPDRFQWRHYPVTTEQAYNPNYHLVLAQSKYVDLPIYRVENTTSTLTIKITNASLAGDYQCLAHYGAEVVASLPGRISIADVKQFPKQSSTDIAVTAGNTVLWRCGIPESNPPAYIDYFKGNTFVSQEYMKRPTSLILANVSKHDSGLYTCWAFNNLKPPKFNSTSTLKLVVVPRGPPSAPKFLVTPKATYTVKQAFNVFMECAAIGTPVPTVTWHKVGGEMSKTRTKMEMGGLSIVNATSSDAGEYVCNHTNSEGFVAHRIHLEYHEAPKVIKGPYITNLTSENIQEGEDIDLVCDVAGSPKPVVSWFLNGRIVARDRHIKTHGNHLLFRPLEKKHAGMIQCFASNIVRTDYGLFSIQVIPKQISGSDIVELRPAVPNHKRKKHKPKKSHKGTAEMIPPSKPNVTRNSDESVVVRWHVPPDTGLPIKFFKVQYREMGVSNAGSSAAKWITTNADIPPSIRSFEVNGLKPDHDYRFRIAAVYSNDDNKSSDKSDVFHLSKSDFDERNPLPVPTITSTETVNSSSIRVFWDYTPAPNITIDGFVVNYMSASSAGDYNKAMVDGEYVRSFVITHLDPGTIYDVKMQSFTSTSASEFSPVMHQRTAPLVAETTTMPTTKKPETDLAASTDLYVFVGAGVLVLTLCLTTVVFLIVCRKWKQKKNENSADIRGSKPEDLNHHIQMEGNDYVISPKILPLSNGCVLSPNHMTIRANPLAEADNKNQNMIEMSCLSTQNNNCSTQPSVSTKEMHGSDAATKIKDKSKRHKGKGSTAPGENYV